MKCALDYFGLGISGRVFELLISWDQDSIPSTIIHPMPNMENCISARFGSSTGVSGPSFRHEQLSRL